MSDDLSPTDVEIRIVHLLRERVEEAIAANGKQWAANCLHVSPPGVDAVLWRPEWSVGTAVHVAGLLGVFTNADLDLLEGSAASR